MQELVKFGEYAIFGVMFLASILAVAVFIERFLVFERNASKLREGLIPRVIPFLRKRDTQAALNSLQGETGVYARFIQFSLERIGEGSQAGLSDLMDGNIIQEKVKLEENLSILNTLGNNAPFIGLLGTVLGVIGAFYKLGTLGNSGADVVMRSISTALYATAAGLAVAIPVVMANNYFTRRLKVILSNLEFLSKEFLGNFQVK